MSGSLKLIGGVRVHAASDEPAVRAATDDLSRDLGWLLGEAPAAAAHDEAVIRGRIEPGLGVEAYRVTVGEERVDIVGGDTLGLVYGLYAFSRHWLGVDPMWFWKDRFPQRREVLVLTEGELASTPRTFGFRGWFINDEDLLSEWRLGGGKRDLDYPYYDHVIHPQVMDKICESLLRLECNLLIPSSFIDVMNPPEAALVQAVAQRGLYVSQHHIEPLGVSHFGYETFWRSRGEEKQFDFAEDAESVEFAWRNYAKHWWELAGRQVVWQLGLRGRGDRPVWESVKNISEEEAGRFISGAIEKQWQIVREIDDREAPPCTSTLWMEGHALMKRNALRFPPGVTLVFSDEGLTQTLQDDFDDTPRKPDRGYGLYSHICFWSRGPHLVQGTRPEKIRQQYDAAVEKGDVAYAIVNVANIREHVLGVEATAALMTRGAYDFGEHLAAFAPASLRPLYRRFLDDCLIDASGSVVTQDGALSRAVMALLDELRGPKGRRLNEHFLTNRLGFAQPDRFPDKVQEAQQQVERLITDYDAIDLSPADRPFFDVNLKLQSQILLALYRTILSLLRARNGEQAGVQEARATLDWILEARQAGEVGKWEHWYRGDDKLDLRDLRRRVEALSARESDA